MILFSVNKHKTRLSSPGSGSDLGFCTALPCTSSFTITATCSISIFQYKKFKLLWIFWWSLIVLKWSFRVYARLFLRENAASLQSVWEALLQSALQTPQYTAGVMLLLCKNILRCCIFCKECSEIRRWCLQVYSRSCVIISPQNSERILPSSQSQQLVHPHISYLILIKWDVLDSIWRRQVTK